MGQEQAGAVSAGKSGLAAVAAALRDARALVRDEGSRRTVTEAFGLALNGRAEAAREKLEGADRADLRDVGGRVVEFAQALVEIATGGAATADAEPKPVSESSP